MLIAIILYNVFYNQFMLLASQTDNSRLLTLLSYLLIITRGKLRLAFKRLGRNLPMCRIY